MIAIWKGMLGVAGSLEWRIRVSKKEVKLTDLGLGLKLNCGGGGGGREGSEPQVLILNPQQAYGYTKRKDSSVKIPKISLWFYSLPAYTRREREYIVTRNCVYCIGGFDFKWLP